MTLFPFVVNEVVVIRVFLVFLVMFAVCWRPVVIRREESIGLFGRVINLCQVEAIGLFDGFGIDTGAADNVNGFIGTAVTECCFQ